MKHQYLNAIYKLEYCSVPHFYLPGKMFQFKTFVFMQEIKSLFLKISKQGFLVHLSQGVHRAMSVCGLNHENPFDQFL